MDTPPHVLATEPGGTTNDVGTATSTSVVWRIALLIALLFLCLHLPWWPPGADDLDAANYMAGIRDFDPARHQPHPPGYPVYIVLGKISAAALHLAGTASAGGRLEAWALAFWSMIGGAGVLLGMVALLRAVQRVSAAPADAALPLSSAAVLAASPLAWIGAARPMTDVVGLALTVAVQALVFNAIGACAPVRRARILTLGALLAGLAVGIRTQTLLLTAPVLALGMVQQVRRGEIKGTPPVFVAAIIGCLAWFVPMVVVVGGLERYASALGGQAGDDFGTAAMLWSHHSRTAVLAALGNTFLDPWETLPLGVAVLVLGFAGGVALMRRAPRFLLLLFVAFGPYMVFHLLFQEGANTRYALPIAVLVTTLACAGLAAGGRTVHRVGAVALVVACLWIDLPLAALYARSPLPSETIIGAMDAATTRPAIAVVHHSIAQVLRSSRPLPAWMQAPGYHREWNAVRTYWERGGAGEVWIAADPLRLDLSTEQLPSIDPASWNVTVFPWALTTAPVWGNSRPEDVAWYRINRPRWWVDVGWALTPELGGQARVAERSLTEGGITGGVMRGDAPVRVVLEGRHLGTASDPPLNFELALDAQVLERWQVAPNSAYLQWFSWPRVPPGDGAYARLTVTARPARAVQHRVLATVEQFNLQPTGALVTAYGHGWHLAEADAAGAFRRHWRWTSGSAEFLVRGARGDVVFHLRGESPRRYFDTAPEVTVRAGARVLRRETVDADFDWRVVVPADALREADGVLSIATSRTFSPSERGNSPDRRRLGLRILACDVTAAR